MPEPRAAGSAKVPAGPGMQNLQASAKATAASAPNPARLLVLKLDFAVGPGAVKRLKFPGTYVEITALLMFPGKIVFEMSI